MSSITLAGNLYFINKMLKQNIDDYDDDDAMSNSQGF